MIGAVLSAQISHWRRNRLQLVTLILGMALATALWSGVQAINAEARASYASAAAEIDRSGRPTLRAAAGERISLRTYASLRRAGWPVAPVIEVTIADGVRLIGTDPLSDGGAALGDLGPADGIVAIGRAEALDALPDGLDVATLADDQAPAGLILTDISVAARLAGSPDPTQLVLTGEPPFGLPPLQSVAPELRLITASTGTDLARLTDSFHLNLTAFGLLSFAVGIFIVQSAIGLAFEQRRPLVRTLRSLGVPLRHLLAVTAGELLVLAVVGGGLGIVLGYLVAAALLPDVAATLRGLYGAEVGGTLRIRPVWWLSGMAMALTGTGLAAAGAMIRTARMPILASARPRAWAQTSRRAAERLAMGGAALIVVAGLLTALPPSIPAAFGMMGGVLTGAALLLPWVLLGLVGMMERLGSGVLWTWFWADTRQQLPGLSLALMALLLALAANVGVTTMVSSFRLTFVGFLDQRLAAEMYVNAAGEDGLEDWLAQRADALLPIQSANRTVAGQAAKIYGTRDHSTYPDNWRMLQATASPWADLHSGTAALINEQLARRAGLGIGDQIEVESRLFAVAGIFGDYGNPVGQVMLDEQVWHDLFPRDPARQFAVRVAADKVAALRTDTIAAFDLSPESVVDQATVKSISLAIFERTFVVTGALNVLTLLVAAFALFMSLLTLSDMRLPQVAPVWALGLTRRSLGWVEAARALGLAALTAVLALPLGLGLAWILLAVVNVQAFGWKLPMFLFPRDYALLGVEALAVAAIAAVWPSLRLSRQPASKLLGIFASER